MNKIVTNTFIGGMNKDLSPSLMPSNKYIDAQNYRIVTTDGNTTGSLENIKGTKFLLDTITSVGSIQLVYGYLYNWYAATNASNIASAGWHVATNSNWTTLVTYLGGAAVAGGKLKEVGTTYWANPNTGATNEVNFNLRAGGHRAESNGSFAGFTNWIRVWAINGASPDCFLANTNNAASQQLTYYTRQGSYIRLVKDSTTLLNGQTGTYTGNDGKVYRTICIGTQEWLADDLCETLYRDGSAIPEISDNAAWAALNTGARCSYNNIEDNAFITVYTGIVASHQYLVVKDSITYNGVVYASGTTFTGVGGVTIWSGDGLPIDITDSIVNGYICGAKQLRDCIILFVTTNTTAAPVTGDGDSRIYKLVIDTASEVQTSLTLLYDDSLNADASDLCFSTANQIKAITKYETPNVQKVYWTDGYNNIRYANIAANLTVDGTAYAAPGDYMTVDKFEFLPKFTSVKPTLSSIIGGKIKVGIVAYAYQLYNIYGSTTAFSILSDPIHLTTSNDTMASTREYYGGEVDENSGKGVIMSINNTGNDGFTRLRLVRVHYSHINSTPTIDIATEIEIPSTGNIILVTDTGNSLGQLTVDEFNIASTELFKCQDIEVKDERLFAANITKSEFDISNFDCRAIRYRHNSAVPASATIEKSSAFTDGGVSFTRLTNSSFRVIISNWSTHVGVPLGRTVTGVTAITSNSLFDATNGDWHDVANNPTAFSSTPAATIFSILSYTTGSDQLTFTLTKDGGTYFTDDFDHFDVAVIFQIQYSYTYTSNTTYDNAVLSDSLLPDITITVPGVDNIAGWNAAGWTNYTSTHDGINKFNNTANDGNTVYDFKYQSNCSIVGAEGPNVKIDFATEVFDLDTSNDNLTFYATSPDDATDLSYKNYASPWKDGKLSWQRDEVYRLYAVFGNNRGQLSDPKWITDLRMPSLHDADFLNSSGATVKPSVLSTVDGTVIKSYRLYPRIYFKSLPADATFVQIHRVKRERIDRSVVSQGLVVSTDVVLGVQVCKSVSTALPNTNTIIKFTSPEILSSNNINIQSNDYLEYLGTYGTVGSTTRVPDTILGVTPLISHTIRKYKAAARVPFTTNCVTNIADSVNVLPFVANSNAYATIDSVLLANAYSGVDGWGKGCTGIAISYGNASWSAINNGYVVANLKSNVFGSQYGGNTYENRQANISIPCSDRIYAASQWNDISYGDTFINYADIAVSLYDLTFEWSVDDSILETVYVPFESSINSDLINCPEARHRLSEFTVPLAFTQEYSGTHTDISGTTFSQTKRLYNYNTVYSQQIDLQAAITLVTDKILETEFDSMIKVSNKKSNGEIQDSWTNFAINDFIEVDSIYGPVNALKNFNNRLIYFQDECFGILSVNDRSLITDSSSSQLVLGTGGILDRYDYISNIIGCKDKFSVTTGSTGMFWYDRINNIIAKYSNSIEKVSLAKGVQSYINNNVLTSQSVISHADVNNNEILFTFFVGPGATTTSFTLAYSENIDAFTSFYTFIPNIYIPYYNRYLTTTRSKYCSNKFNLDYLFLHDSDIYPRCNFYGLYDNDTTTFNNCTLKVLFNPEFDVVKTWDDLVFISNVYYNDVDLYNQTLNTIRCYNTFQNTDYVTLVYKTNLERRERGWTTVVPRNALTTNVTSNPNIFTSAVDTTRLYRERLVDNYMYMDSTFVNSATKDKIVLNNLSAKYRVSYR